MSHKYKTWVEISKKALRNNAEVARRLLMPDTKLLAVVKANAYGHGLVETSNLFSNLTDWFGVDNIDEAVLLRKTGIKMPVLVMGHTSADRFPEAVKHGIRLTIYNSLPSDISPSLTLHLKVDTGMSRQGVTVLDLPNFLKLLPKNANIEGVFTHFADADNLKDGSYTGLQLANFKYALEILEKHHIKPKIIHTSATTGLLTMPETQFNMVRLGIALYGLWPSAEFEKKFKKLNLQPALTWKTRVAQIKNIKKGVSVGYGITEKVKRDSIIGVLPVGYYDGYDRFLSSIGEVLVGGKRCKILGRVSMNLMVADISNVKNPKLWDEVILIGEQDNEHITAEELAEKIGTISYEVVSRINPLLPRVVI